MEKQMPGSSQLQFFVELFEPCYYTNAPFDPCRFAYKLEASIQIILLPLPDKTNIWNRSIHYKDAGVFKMVLVSS